MTDYITRGEMPKPGPNHTMIQGGEIKGDAVFVGGRPSDGYGRAEVLGGGPLGTVSRDQAGILPMAGLRISDEMIARACIAHPDVAPEKIRSILEVGISYLKR